MNLSYKGSEWVDVYNVVGRGGARPLLTIVYVPAQSEHIQQTKPYSSYPQSQCGQVSWSCDCDHLFFFPPSKIIFTLDMWLYKCNCSWGQLWFIVLITDFSVGTWLSSFFICQTRATELLALARGCKPSSAYYSGQKDFP